MNDPHLNQWEKLLERIPTLQNNTDLPDKEFEKAKKFRQEVVQELVDNAQIV